MPWSFVSVIKIPLSIHGPITEEQFLFDNSTMKGWSVNCLSVGRPFVRFFLKKTTPQDLSQISIWLLVTCVTKTLSQAVLPLTKDGGCSANAFTTFLLFKAWTFYFQSDPLFLLNSRFDLKQPSVLITTPQRPNDDRLFQLFHAIICCLPAVRLLHWVCHDVKLCDNS